MVACVSCMVREFARLHLQGNKLRGSIPAEIGLLSSLTELYLQSNDITGEIPATLGNCIALQIFHLNDNRITGHGKRSRLQLLLLAPSSAAKKGEKTITIQLMVQQLSLFDLNYKVSTVWIYNLGSLIRFVLFWLFNLDWTNVLKIGLATFHLVIWSDTCSP